MQMKPSTYRTFTFEQARATSLALAPPPQPEQCELALAAGRTLLEDVVAGESLPALATSAVDGYALNAGDETLRRRVLEEITAGRLAANQLSPGSASRIMTGAPLPPGADAVIMVEETDEQNGVVQLRRAPRPGENVIAPGFNLRAGEVVLARGAALGAAEIALLAAVGRRTVEVARQPLVAVLSTGDELVAHDEPLSGSMVRDSNQPGLLAAIAAAGARPLGLGRVRDDRPQQQRAIERGLAAADVLILSGGVSVGSRDLIKPILAELGTIHFGRVAVRPGRPLTFASVGEKLVFGLPGFPVSSLVTFELFVRPLLLLAQGRRQIERPLVTVRLQHDYGRQPDRVDFARAVVSLVEGRLHAVTTGPQGSSRLLSLVGANALLRVEPGEQPARQGDQLPAILTGPLRGE